MGLGTIVPFTSPVYKLPSDRFYATYFGGDEKLGLPADTEARDNWLQFLPPSHVLPFGCKVCPRSSRQFLGMGDTGPCGPCTEIHFDRIGNRDAASFVNNDDPTVIEIWNLVFIQFNRESDGSLKSLPAKHATGARPYSGKVGPDDSDKVDMAYRVVADHIRTISFAIADGSCPGNEGREFVLRRILRRAVRYGTEVLKAQQGFFNGLVNIVIEVMGDVFSELKQHAIKIRKIIADEEASFGRTLVKGIEKFMKAAQELQGTIHSGQEHSNVIKVIYTGSEFLESVIPGEEVGIILETTTFYAEQGGQKYDTGLLEGPDGVFEVSNVQIYGTHITNTRDAKALALLSEEGIAKGICRVTAVTMDCAFKAVELAASLEQEVNEASKTEGSILEQKVTYLNNRVEGASIPSAKKADLNAKISALQSQVIKAKKEISEENIQKAIKVATQMAEVAFSNGKDYCVSHVNVGSDTAAIREAVVKVMEQKVSATSYLCFDS
ncbi:hypothetical protein Pfo_028030 [Paulownia fortunei]|nr:hypothetical protein Pfo_028030 [Paulownia fortunei]